MQYPSWNRLVSRYAGMISKLILEKSAGNVEQLINSPQFRADAEKVASNMVQEVKTVNARSWREAAQKAQQGKRFYRALQADFERLHLYPYLEAIARRNARLIHSLPNKLSNQMTVRAQELFQSGKRPAEIERELKQYAPYLAKWHAKLIARTEVGRAETDITRARAESIDIPAYQWHTSEDGRVRDSHRNMQGVIVFWGDPPNPEALLKEKNNHGPYHAGSIYNCRCVSLPIVVLDEISWPARVYYHGSLTRMTRKQFSVLAGYPKAA